MKRISLAAAAVCLALLCGCALKTEVKQTQTYIGIFDTVCSATIYAEEQLGGGALEETERLLLEYNQLYDIYTDYEGINNLKTINENAGVAPVKVDGRIIDLLLYAEEMYNLTGGKMNVAMGSVLAIWHDYRENGSASPETAQLPPAELLEEARKHTDINDVIIDRENCTVFLRDPKMRLDVGAVAKGYAVERVAERIKDMGVTNFLLSGAGNVCASGKKPDSPWAVGVQDPGAPTGQNYVCVVEVADCSVVTSGNYERYYTVDGKRYHHIIDPETLMPSEYFVSVTIIADSSALSDALSTALFNMPPEQGLALIESIEGAEALLIDPAGGVHYSSGFGAYIRKGN